MNPVGSDQEKSDKKEFFDHSTVGVAEATSPHSSGHLSADDGIAYTHSTKNDAARNPKIITYRTHLGERVTFPSDHHPPPLPTASGSENQNQFLASSSLSPHQTGTKNVGADDAVTTVTGIPETSTVRLGENLSTLPKKRKAQKPESRTSEGRTHDTGVVVPSSGSNKKKKNTTSVSPYSSPLSIHGVVAPGSITPDQISKSSSANPQSVAVITSSQMEQNPQDHVVRSNEISSTSGEVHTSGHSSLRDKFPLRLYDMIDYCDAHHNEICRWTGKGDGFVVADPSRIANTIIPSYFCHSNYTSFIRQLNNYGFSKRSEAAIPHAAVMERNSSVPVNFCGNTSKVAASISSLTETAPAGILSAPNSGTDDLVNATNSNEVRIETPFEDQLNDARDLDSSASNHASGLLKEAAASLDSSSAGATAEVLAIGAASRVTTDENKFEIFHHKDHFFLRGRRDLLGSITRLPTERKISTVAAAAAVCTTDRFEERVVERIDKRIARLEEKVSSCQDVLIQGLDRIEQLMSKLIEERASESTHRPRDAQADGPGEKKERRLEIAFADGNTTGSAPCQRAARASETSPLVASLAITDDGRNHGLSLAASTDINVGNPDVAALVGETPALGELTDRRSELVGGIPFTDMAAVILASRQIAEAELALRAAFEARLIESQQQARLEAQAAAGISFVSQPLLQGITLRSANTPQISNALASLLCAAAGNVGTSSPADPGDPPREKASDQVGRREASRTDRSGNISTSPTPETVPSLDVSASAEASSRTGIPNSPSQFAPALASIEMDNNATSWDRFLATNFLSPVSLPLGEGAGAGDRGPVMHTTQHQQALLLQRHRGEQQHRSQQTKERNQSNTTR